MWYGDQPRVKEPVKHLKWSLNLKDFILQKKLYLIFKDFVSECDQIHKKLQI